MLHPSLSILQTYLGEKFILLICNILKNPRLESISLKMSHNDSLCVAIVSSKSIRWHNYCELSMVQKMDFLREEKICRVWPSGRRIMILATLR